ncbi:MAG: VWA domain-containing protein [Actinomycetota bacterium]|nr:VWA domain-containing protein [Actinomycetota bacterium]
MKLNAKLDVDVLALQEDDEVTCLLRFDAPIPDGLADRPGETLVVVVDRSGSMSGEPIEAVRASLHALAGRVKPQDNFGVVVFDNEASVAVPCRPIRDHHLPTVHGLIDGIDPGGSTDLSGGYLLGLSEARRNIGATGATVLLLSDGHANAGVTDPVAVGGLAAKARDERITSGTIGIGHGYDEILLAEIASSGNGSHRFALTADDAEATVGEEAGDLLSKAIVNAMVRIKPTDPAHIDRIGLLHDVRRWLEEDASGEKVIVVPLGDLYAGEQRELLVKFDVPAIAALGHHVLAEFSIEYVALPGLESEVITWPMAVNVVPGDEASGRVPDPTVTTARLLLEAANAKKQAADELRHGDVDGAVAMLRLQSEHITGALRAIDDDAPEADALRALLAEEAEQVERLTRGAQEMPAAMAAKSMTEDWTNQARGRNDVDRKRRNRGKRDF